MFCLKILNGQEKVVFLTFPKTLEISLLWYIKPIKVKYITIQKKSTKRKLFSRSTTHFKTHRMYKHYTSTIFLNTHSKNEPY